MTTLRFRQYCGLFALLALGFGLQTTLAQAQVTIPNAGFEEGTNGWHAADTDSAGKISTVSPDAAHTGTNGLHVKTDETGPGSWMQSPKVTIESGKTYHLNFFARLHQVSGVGVFVQFFDANGTNIPSKLAMAVPQAASDWTEYHLDVPAPTGAATMSFAIHAYSKHVCDADFDDFSLTQ